MASSRTGPLPGRAFRYIGSIYRTIAKQVPTCGSEASSSAVAVAWKVVTLRPQMIRGAPAKPGGATQVSYRLARDAVVRNFRNGRLSHLDVCDAHPELLRAAQNIGEATQELCPICEEENVVLVSYVFGTGLGPGGHCVTTKTELNRLRRRASDLTCYVVEVCPACRWNHLARSFQLPGRRARRA